MMFKKNSFISLPVITKWLWLCLTMSLFIGSASAFFLTTLNWVTNYREAHINLIYFLPSIGFTIGLAYKYFGKNIQSGNNLLIETILEPKEIIPIKMAPMIYLGTILTHLFGGSAGREGTALQMAGSIADQLSKPFRLKKEQRSILIIAAIAGGFAAVFGTPLTGAVFALELLLIRKITFKAIFPALITAYASNLICNLWKVPHTHYQINNIPDFNILNVLLVIVAGILFGLCALVFSRSMHILSSIFQKIKYEPLRPLVGGIILIFGIFTLDNTTYIGLGIPEIVNSFDQISPSYTFALKVAFTIVTLSSGFKGGEVTPLFFIGATLGSALSFWLPLPTSLLAGLGFVAVFAGATNAPFACAIMACELFGIAILPYAIIACAISFLTSGQKGIYTSQPKLVRKYHRYTRMNTGKIQNL